jgi:RNA polymerase sigma-70 factor (ECF subfamily)
VSTDFITIPPFLRPTGGLDHETAPPLDGLIGRVIEGQLRALLRTAERCLGSHLRTRGDASDLVQQTCFEALRDAHKFQGCTEAEAKRWLRAILLNNVRSLGRKCRRPGDRGDAREVSLDALLGEDGDAAGWAADAPAPGGRLIEWERARALWAAVGRLPEDDRRLMYDRLSDGLSYKEIGRRRGCSHAAARKQWLRVLDRLREDLVDDWES